MSAKTTLFLGRCQAAHLRRLTSAEHRIVVVEKKETFSLCMANLWLMTGDRQTPEEGEREMSKLAAKGIALEAHPRGRDRRQRHGLELRIAAVHDAVRVQREVRAAQRAAREVEARDRGACLAHFHGSSIG